MTLLEYYLLFSDSYKPPGNSLASNEISLTFDDGPDPIYTPIILNILASYNLKATFFLVGKQVEKFPELAKRIVHEGHTVGNHSWSHAPLFLQRIEKINKDIDKTQELIKETTGMRPHLFRAPWGLTGQRVDKIILDKQLKSVLWTHALKDWRPSSALQLEQRFKKGLKGLNT